MKKNKGFTLIELLATIVLMGLIILMVFPSINRLRQNNEAQTYELYGESMEEAARVYVGKEGEDLTSLGTNHWIGCVAIDLKDDLIANDLIDTFEDNGAVCNQGTVLYQKTEEGEKYSYNLTCTKEGEVVYQKQDVSDSIINSCTQTATEVPTYRIDTAQITGGTITKVQRFEKAGETVTFEVNPEGNFTYYGATIKDTRGNNLITLDQNTTSFKMPEQAVTISPKWKYNDLKVMNLDNSRDTTWSSNLTDGAIMNWSFDTNRHYFGGTIGTTGNSRRGFWTDKSYDLTHYATFQMKAYEYTTNSSYSADTYHITMYAGVAKNNTTWPHAGTAKKELKATGHMKYVTLDVDITNLTGTYYLGFEILSNSHPFGCNVTHATLIGRVYQ